MLEEVLSIPSTPGEFRILAASWLRDATRSGMCPMMARLTYTDLPSDHSGFRDAWGSPSVPFRLPGVPIGGAATIEIVSESFLVGSFENTFEGPAG